MCPLSCLSERIKIFSFDLSVDKEQLDHACRPGGVVQSVTCLTAAIRV